MASETWSVGVVLYELLTLERPFDADNLVGFMDAVRRGAMRMEPLERCGHDPALRELVSQRALLCVEPASRLSLDAMLRRLEEFAVTRRLLITL